MHARHAATPNRRVLPAACAAHRSFYFGGARMSGRSTWKTGEGDADSKTSNTRPYTRMRH